jgi:uncharacterized protein
VVSGDATAFIEYTRGGGRIELIHTEVPEALAGQGVGSKLVRGVLDRIQGEGAKVTPRCEFVTRFIERHPDYQPLVADD